MYPPKEYAADMQRVAELHLESFRTPTVAVLRLPDAHPGTAFLLEVCPELRGNPTPHRPYFFGPSESFRYPLALSLAPPSSILSRAKRSPSFARDVASATVLAERNGEGHELIKAVKRLLDRRPENQVHPT